MPDPFVGEIRMFAGNFAPRNWAYCNGQLMTITSNQALFSILGTSYGGDGRTTFGLPDFQGRMPMNIGTGPGLSTHPLGNRSGSEINRLSVPNIPRLSVTIKASTADATTDIPDSQKCLAKSISATAPAHTIEIYGSNPDTTIIGGETIGTDGNPFGNMPPYLAISFIIALYGVYPSRS